MADSQSIAVLNIGSQQVTMGLVSVSNSGKLVLKKYDTATILADPAAEMTRLPQIRMAIAELVSKLGIAKRKVSYAVSGQSVFTRFLKLPSLGDDDIEQLVEFEAQQHVPFPINEVIWDWQLLSSEAGQKEVVLVAIKSDALDDINDCVTDANVTTSLVDASPMALANAFNYSYTDLDEPALMIDMGARTSNLVYIDGDKVFTRTIAIGGATLTAAIAKEYNVSFIEAEEQKCSHGLVALDTRHTSQLDEMTAALGSCIKSALNRMPAEIARTTNFFRSQHGGSAPKRVFLAGGGCNLPLISDFFQDKLKLTVEYFNPLRKVSVGKNIDVDKVSVEAHQLGEIIGLALRSSSVSKMQIDLVPDSVQHERDDAKKRPKLFIASGITIASCAAFCFNGISSKNAVLKDAGEQKKIVNGLNKFAAPIKNDLADAKKIGKVIDMYDRLVQERDIWIRVLGDIKKHFAHPELWITEMEPVINFDPILGEENAKPYIEFIDKAFEAKAYGGTSIKMPAMKSKFDANGKINPSYIPFSINAIRINGLWRGESNNLITNQVEKLLKKSNIFGKTIMRKTERSYKEFQIETNDIIVEYATSSEKNTIGATFTLIIPLNNPILINKSK